MIQETRLRVVDNSGGKIVKVIRSGLLSLVRVTLVFPSRKVKKGEIHPACVIGKRMPLSRLTGITVKSYDNEVILLKKDSSLLGTRVYRPIFLELRFLGLSRILTVAKSIY